jgi:hypothetical protein
MKCNSKVSSAINALVFPFVTSINFVTLVNGNSVGCLLFHCSNWCAISVLRNGNTQKTLLAMSSFVWVFLLFAGWA